MKILMGAVIVLSMAAVTACGKKPEVVEEKTVESVHEEPEMADEQMTGSEHEETTESVDEEIAEITESAGQGFERVANQSAWNGTYYREDGEYITVYDTDEDYLFLSCPESNYEQMIDILQFTGCGKNTGSLSNPGYNGSLYTFGRCPFCRFRYSIYSIYARGLLQEKRCFLLENRNRWD